MAWSQHTIKDCEIWFRKKLMINVLEDSYCSYFFIIIPGLTEDEQSNNAVLALLGVDDIGGLNSSSQTLYLKIRI